MIEGLSPTTLISGALVIGSGVASWWTSRSKADKTVADTLVKKLIELEEELEKQRQIDRRLQLQINEKNSEINELRAQNEQEEKELLACELKLEDAS